MLREEPCPESLARAHLPTYQPLAVAVVSLNVLLPAVREFKELSDLLRGHIPKALAKALLPEAAVDHARSAVEPDTRMRRWRPHPESPFELLYRSRQAQVRWSIPAGSITTFLSVLATLQFYHYSRCWKTCEACKRNLPRYPETQFLRSLRVCIICKRQKCVSQRLLIKCCKDSSSSALRAFLTPILSNLARIAGVIKQHHKQAPGSAVQVFFQSCFL